ncbi:MAG: Ig-like domain-containing protein [Verrucomicrobiota bacterium]
MFSLYLSFLAVVAVSKADDLQGQNSNGSGVPTGVWSSGNLQNWKELEYIPCRVTLNGGPTSNKTVTVDFPHSAGGTPGIENLTSFVPSSNVVITAGPTLTQAGENWTYTLKVNITNNQLGTVQFFARMRAGAHNFGGSSLMISSPPLQIHKPDPGPGIPNLVAKKIGPATAAPGDVITYTIYYTNKVTAANAATGVQLTDVLPSSVTYLPGSATAGGVAFGDNIVWDLPNLAIGASGVVTYQATVNSNVVSGSSFHNSVEILSAEDDFDYSDNTSIVTTLVAFNRAPVANPDSYTVSEDDVLNVSASGILANDTDADGNSLTAVLVSNPIHGTLTLNANGSFAYSPEANFNGTDSFTYRANDGTNNSGVATVTISVTSVNDAPVANHDSYTVAEAGTLTRTSANGVLINDTDAETNSLTAILVSGPSKGTLTLNSDGSFTYVHNGSETTSDSFSYKANDGSLDSGVATVTITITPVNDAPVANDDFYTVAEAGTLSRTSANGVLLNDTDAETNSLTAILVSGPSKGTLTLNSDGSFTYVHNGSETTSDSFSYKANDGSLDSGVATVTITITPVNDAPVANNDAYEIYEDTTLTISAPGILANDNDAETNLLSAIVVSTTTNGTLTLDADGSFSYLPNANFNGVDSFTYTATDTAANSLVATVNLTIHPVNDSPNFTAGFSQLINQNTGSQMIQNWATNIQAGPANEQNQTVAFQVSNNNTGLFSEQPAISANGTLSFTPAFNASGSASVAVALKDNGGTANGGVDTSPTRIFSITVNAPPTVNLISPTNQSTFVWGQNITLIAEAIDLDGSVTNVEFFAGTSKLGEVSAAPYFQVLTNMQPGTYQFTAVATDNLGLSATSSVITVTVLNSLPFTQPGPMVLNRQTGLIEQRIRVGNPTPLTLSAARVLVFNLPSGVRVYNASGTNNGIPFVQYNQPIFPGGSAEMLIEYLVPSRVPPSTTLILEIVPTSPAAETVVGLPQKIDRALWFTGGTFLIEFTSVANRFYSIQYSSDLVTWKASSSVQGTGSKVQWIDNGSPKTESLPANSGQRFYRIIRLP